MIEQFLDENEIIYARKVGDIGISPKRNYTHKISIEKFGQILFAHQGFPDKASNQKKQIFDKYYNTIFSEPNFDLNSSAQLVRKYFEIKKIYDTSNYPSTDQKIFYILYIDRKLNISIEKQITHFENTLKQYRQDEMISEARKLINTKFKQVLDDDLINYE